MLKYTATHLRQNFCRTFYDRTFSDIVYITMNYDQRTLNVHIKDKYLLK